MYTIHTTPGFVIGSKPFGDTGKILALFTKDFGLVYATAQGIRLEKSKLRYHVQDYSWGVYSLVRGKEYWRMTGAGENVQCPMPDLTAQAGGRQAMINVQSGAKELLARIALLLRRLLHGEEAHPELFDHVSECAKFLSQSDLSSTKLNDGEMQTLESLVVARMLHVLGYIGNVVGLNEELKSTEISQQLLNRLDKERPMINQHINKALKESML